MSLPGRLVELPQGRMFVHQEGQGPPLVLLHGFLVSHFYFRPILEELARHFEVFALDLIGQGESDHPSPDRFSYRLPALADAVTACLDALSLPRVRLFGHSMGGAVALTLAARHPDRVHRLLLEDAAVYPLPLPLSAKLALVPGIGPILFKRLYSRADLARHFRSVYQNPSLATDELIDYYWERFNRAGARDACYALLRTLASMPEQNGDIGRVQCPLLIAWGAEDQTTPVELGRRLANELPSARFEVIPGCAHSPHEERPQELLATVLPFLLDRAN